MSLEIRVDTREVTEALDKLDNRESADAMKKAIRKGVQYLKPKVKAEAPKARKSKNPGNLRKNVKYKVKKSRKYSGAYYGVVRSFARHHHLVVDGSKRRFTKGTGAFRGVMPTNAYVDRVADSDGDVALDIAEAELVRVLGL